MLTGLYEAKPVGCYHQNWQKSVRSQGGFGDELIPPALAVVCLDLLFMLVLKRFPSSP